MRKAGCAFGDSLLEKLRPTLQLRGSNKCKKRSQSSQNEVLYIGKCSNAPNLGWITTGKTKKGLKHRPKRMLDNVDPRTFRSHPIEDDFANWLADSKQVWDQIRFHLATKNQIKSDANACRDVTELFVVFTLQERCGI